MHVRISRTSDASLTEIMSASSGRKCTFSCFIQATCCCLLTTFVWRESLWLVVIPEPFEIVHDVATRCPRVIVRIDPDESPTHWKRWNSTTFSSTRNIFLFISCFESYLSANKSALLCFEHSVFFYIKIILNTQ